MHKEDPYAALRYPEFRYFVLTQFLYTIAIQTQEVVIGFYLYDKTGDPLTLGMIGLFVALPYISITLFGGYLADKYDKRTISQICFFIIAAISTLLIWATHPSTGLGLDDQKTIIYSTVFIYGLARGFYSPAWSSLKPYLVEPIHYANSSTWSSQFWQTGMIVGPAAAGFLYAYLGLTNTLWLVFGLLVLVILTSTQIKKRKVTPSTSTLSLFKSLQEGFRFVASNKILLYSIFLDMISVLFGGVIAILPVFAKDILLVGPEGLGVLRAAPGIGAVLTMWLLAYFNPTHQAWRNMLLAVAGFGVATLVFGLSTNFYLSIIALFFTGAFDSISVVIRSTILQTLPPDAMRGRVTAVNGIFVSTSNELGAFESGLAARLLGTIPSVIFGGTMTLVVVSYIYAKSRELLHVRLNDFTINE